VRKGGQNARPFGQEKKKGKPITTDYAEKTQQTNTDIQGRQRIKKTTKRQEVIQGPHHFSQKKK